MKAPRRNVMRAVLEDIHNFQGEVQLPISASALWEDEHLLPALAICAPLLHGVQGLLSRVWVCPMDQQGLCVPVLVFKWRFFLYGWLPVKKKFIPFSSLKGSQARQRIFLLT